MSEVVGGARLGTLNSIGGVALAAFGAALLGWAAWSSLQPQSLPYAQSLASAAATEAFPGVGLERLDIRASGGDRTVASGFVTRETGREAPLSWSNAVTEPVFFPDLDPGDSARVSAAIREHVEVDAIVLAWWDLSRRIRKIAARKAPLDDALARGLLIPSAWTSDAERVLAQQRAFWGAHVTSEEAETFERFLEALAMDEAPGAKALQAIAKGRRAYVAVRLADILRLAAARPAALQVLAKDLAASEAHAAMKAAREWLQENGVAGGYAIEPRGVGTRLYYLPSKQDSQRLLARLLPFSTSNPLALDHFELVYQHGDCWIYRLKPAL